MRSKSGGSPANRPCPGSHLLVLEVLASCRALVLWGALRALRAVPVGWRSRHPVSPKSHQLDVAAPPQSFLPAALLQLRLTLPVELLLTVNSSPLAALVVIEYSVSLPVALST